MKTSLEVKILGEELLQQKWPKHIPIIMFLLVTTVTYLKNKVTVTGFLVTGVIGLGLGRDSGHHLDVWKLCGIGVAAPSQ